MIGIQTVDMTYIRYHCSHLWPVLPLLGPSDDVRHSSLSQLHWRSNLPLWQPSTQQYRSKEASAF